MSLAVRIPLLCPTQEIYSAQEIPSQPKKSDLFSTRNQIYSAQEIPSQHKKSLPSTRMSSNFITLCDCQELDVSRFQRISSPKIFTTHQNTARYAIANFNLIQLIQLCFPSKNLRFFSVLSFCSSYRTKNIDR